jgi:hypothetical protein
MAVYLDQRTKITDSYTFYLKNRSSAMIDHLSFWIFSVSCLVLFLFGAQKMENIVAAYRCRLPPAAIYPFRTSVHRLKVANPVCSM